MNINIELATIAALETQLKTLEEEVAVLVEQKRALTEKRMSSLHNVLLPVFADVDCDFAVHSDEIVFYAKESNRELFTLDMGNEFSFENTPYLQYYTSTSKEECELDRLIALGKVAGIIKNSKEVILAAFKQNDAEFKDLNEQLSEARWDIKAKQDATRRALREIEDKVLLANLETGVVNTTPVKYQKQGNKYFRSTIQSVKIIKTNKVQDKFTVLLTTDEGLDIEVKLDKFNLFSLVKPGL